MKKKSVKKLSAIFIPIIVVLLAIGIVADALSAVYWSVLEATFSDTSGVVDDDYLAAATSEAESINVMLEEEGAVLLKNEAGVLPLSGDEKKVNVYGNLSANMYLNGKGSSASSSTLETVSLKDALSEQGWEVNSTLWNYLASGEAGGSSSNIDEGNITVRTETESSVEEYENVLSWSEAKAYSEYAIVTFGRVGGEGSDMARGENDALAFGDDEIDLVKKLSEEGFKVVLLLNTSHVMSLVPVEEYADAILWVGGPGVKGVTAIGEILTGAVSPSGRLVDTWMADQTTSSTYYTADNYKYVDSSGNTVGGYTNFNEGIYVGYKWYETAYAESFWDVDSYDEIVMYPFGYGLSYGDLNEKITDMKYSDGTFEFTIEAENGNDAPSKDVLELYVEKPYTEGGVEVPKVELVAFEKTDLLSSSEGSQKYTITLSEDDLTVYDETADGGKGAYVLLDGEYKFYLATGDTGSHVWEGADDDHTATYTLTGKEYSESGAGKRESDDVAAHNVFSADYEENGYTNNPMDIDDDNSGFSELSRANGFSNAYGTIFPEDSDDLFSDITLTGSEDIYLALTDNRADYVDYQGEILSNLDVGQKQVYTLEDLYTADADGNPLYEFEEDGEKVVTGSVDYDDPRWDYLISQMSVDDMEKLVSKADWRTMKIDSIGKDTASDYDGPYGLNNLMKASTGQEQHCMTYCSEPVSASTWNAELLEKLGEAVAKEANSTGQSGWYAPGANIHRTPYGGRNAEYFSEDAYLSGVMCASEVEGALSGGLYCYAKHFAFNDIEANRTAEENCWMSEQAAREIYLKPFEIAVKDGGLTGMMTSYMWMCGQWMGANYNIMTNVVRNEWGFKGAINTDNAGAGGIDWMTPIQLVCAGGDLVLQTTYKSMPSDFKSSDAGISALKTSSKHILYMTASAYLYREMAASTGFNVYVPIFVVVNVVVYGGAIALVVVYIVRFRKIQKTNDAGESQEGPDGDRDESGQDLE